MRVGRVYVRDKFAGLIEENDEGEYRFTYDKAYLKSAPSLHKNQAVSLSLPCREEPYLSRSLFAFFDGLIPEGWLLDISVKNWKLLPQDRMGLLLATCHDCIGAVSVKAYEG